jgi:hypothetical protein
MSALGHVWTAPFWQGVFWLQTGRVLSCVRPVDAALSAAGPNAIRWGRVPIISAG